MSEKTDYLEQMRNMFVVSDARIIIRKDAMDEIVKEWDALRAKLEDAKEGFEKISKLEHTGVCDPDDPPQDDCGVCIAELYLQKLEEK